MTMIRPVFVAVAFLAGAVAVFGEGVSPRDFSMSVGAGGTIGGVFTRYTLRADGEIAGEKVRVDANQQMDQFNYGFFAFLDATYGTLGVFFQNGTNTWRQPFFIHDFAGIEDSGHGRETVLGVSLLGRWPFALSDRISVFPMLGMDWHLSLKQRRSLDQSPGWTYDRTDGSVELDADGKAFGHLDFSPFWANVGGGADFDLGEGFFVRGEFLYGFRLMTGYERKNLELMRRETGDKNPKLGGLTSGPSLRLGLGWRFLTLGR